MKDIKHEYSVCNMYRTIIYSMLRVPNAETSDDEEIMIQ